MTRHSRFTGLPFAGKLPGAMQATINYIEPDGGRPVVHMYPPPPGVPVFTGRCTARPVAIGDARGLAGRTSLDREGFLLLRHATKVADFHDETAVRATYYGETERLVREATGAARVLMFDHTIRSARKSGGSGAQDPVRVAHNDYTLASGPQRVRDLLEPAEAAEALRHRFAIVNVWRPIREPVLDTPLALCDARTIAAEDLVATEMRYPERTGETYSLAWNPAHRWYYAPLMRRDEVLVFKCFDSAGDGRPRFSAHTAFDDPATPPGVAARESIEARVLALFAAEGATAPSR